MAGPEVWKVLDQSQSAQSDYQSFRKTDTGIIYLENTSNSAGDEVEIYARFQDDAPDFFLTKYTNSDMTNGTFADVFTPVPAFVAANPTTGSWNVWVDGDW
jgi:hypothetical protein